GGMRNANCRDAPRHLRRTWQTRKAQDPHRLRAMPRRDPRRTTDEDTRGSGGTNQRIGPLESRMTRKCPVRFGGGRMENDAAGYPSRLTHTGSRTPASDGTSPAAYPTRIISKMKPFRWNPAGNQSRPVELDQQPEASLAWWVGNHPCEA